MEQDQQPLEEEDFDLAATRPPLTLGLPHKLSVSLLTGGLLILMAYDEHYQTPGVDFDGGRRVFPHARVAKRWEEGSARSLVTLFEFATSRPDRP